MKFALYILLSFSSIIAFVASYGYYGYGRDVILKQLDTQDEDRRARCVIDMMKKYFAFGKLKVRMGDTIYIKTSSSMPFIQTMMLKTLHHQQKYTILSKNRENLKTQSKEDSDEVSAYIVLIRYPLDIIQDISNMKKLPGWNPQGIFFIVLREDDIDDDSLIGIFNELRKHRIMNAYIITVNDVTYESKSFTWLPYFNGTCGVKCTQLYRLDYCKDKNLEQLNPYQMKIPKNFNRCPIRAAVIVSEPYVLAPRIENNTKFFEKGIEIQLLRVMAQLSNATLVISSLGNYSSGDQLEKIREMMDNEDVDIIAGNIFPGLFTDVQSSVEALRYDFQERITWCIPKAGSIGYLLNLIFIFRFEAWIVIVLMTIMISGVVVLFEVRDNKFHIQSPFIYFFVVFAMLAGCVARIFPRELSFRMILSGWLMAALVTNVIVQSSSQSSLIQPRLEKQIDTFTEVVSSLKIGGHALHVSSFDINIKEEFEFRCKYLICAPIKPCIERVVVKKDFAILAPLRYIDYYEHFEKNSSLPNMYCLRRNVLRTYNPSLMTWRQYPFLENLQVILKRIFESGLVFKWSSDVLQKPTKEKRSGGFRVLGMNNLIGVFNLLFFFWGLSTLVFLMEVITARKQMKFVCTNQCFSSFTARPIFLNIKNKIFSEKYPKNIIDVKKQNKENDLEDIENEIEIDISDPKNLNYAN